MNTVARASGFSTCVVVPPKRGPACGEGRGMGAATSDRSFFAGRDSIGHLRVDGPFADLVFHLVGALPHRRPAMVPGTIAPTASQSAASVGGDREDREAGALELVQPRTLSRRASDPVGVGRTGRPTAAV